ncbi:hypothetical protein QAD02_009100 [Eretmocerus hayati]|uniref:Uncharacterized protein n=1 Tax=Eretmocerus hayati TaxID=131215 RepID=A0ACC2NAS4_9HYME|nr:hypothetical protein QAD02_009100 [Eretmocerus hayati]
MDQTKNKAEPKKSVVAVTDDQHKKSVTAVSDQHKKSIVGDQHKKSVVAIGSEHHKKSVVTMHGRQSRASKISYTEGHGRSKSRAVSRISMGSVNYAGRHSLAWRSGRGGFKEPKYQNSYRLEPYMPFRIEVADKILAQIMTESLKNAEYDVDLTVELSRNIAADVRDKLYRTAYDRVKYVVWIAIMQNSEQSFVTKFGRLWDPTRDHYSVFVFENKTLYAAGLAMAIYYE